MELELLNVGVSSKQQSGSHPCPTYHLVLIPALFGSVDWRRFLPVPMIVACCRFCHVQPIVVAVHSRCSTPPAAAPVAVPGRVGFPFPSPTKTVGPRWVEVAVAADPAWNHPASEETGSGPPLQMAPPRPVAAVVGEGPKQRQRVGVRQPRRRPPLLPARGSRERAGP